MAREPLSKAALAGADPNARRLYDIWVKLPDDPLAERELHKRILEAGNYDPSDDAAASLIRKSLFFVGALRVVMEGSLRKWQPAERFVSWKPVAFGSEAHNAQQREESERRHAERDRATAAAIERSEPTRQRREMVALIDERIDARLAALDGTTATPGGRSSTASIKERLGRLRAA
jgi:hypothetical protein